MVRYYFYKSISNFPPQEKNITVTPTISNITRDDFSRAILDLTYHYPRTDIIDSIKYYNTCIDVALDQNFQVKSFYKSSEKSVKDGLSFLLGTICTVLVARKQYSQFLYHLNSKDFTKQYKKNRSHPDFVGISLGDQRKGKLNPKSLFEAKGGLTWLGNGYSTKNNLPIGANKAAQQLKNVDILIGGVTHKNSNLEKYIVFAHAKTSLDIHVIDPEGNQINKDIIIIDSFELPYQKYNSIINLLLATEDVFYSDGFLYTTIGEVCYGLSSKTLEDLYNILRSKEIPEDIYKSENLSNDIYVSSQSPGPKREKAREHDLRTLKHIYELMNKMAIESSFINNLQNALNLCTTEQVYEKIIFNNFHIIKQKKSINYYSIYHRGVKVGVFTVYPNEKRIVFKMGVYGHSQQKEEFLEEIKKIELDKSWEVRDYKREIVYKEINLSPLEKLDVNFAQEFLSVCEITHRYKS